MTPRARRARSSRVVRSGLVLTVCALVGLVGVVLLGRAHGGTDPVLLGLAGLALIGALTAVAADLGRV